MPPTVIQRYSKRIRKKENKMKEDKHLVQLWINNDYWKFLYMKDRDNPVYEKMAEMAAFTLVQYLWSQNLADEWFYIDNMKRKINDIILEKDKDCLVCTSSKPLMICLPCQHRSLCYDCISEWVCENKNTTCPMCRTPIYGWKPS